MRVSLLCLSLLLLPSLSIAGEADVINAEVEAVGGKFYRFKVTVEHNDEGWEHFAKAWEVLGPDGKILGTRLLRHPHVKEQPFTRTLTVAIPDNINQVKIRAYDLVHEYGGKELTLNINKEKQDEIE